MAKQIIWLRKAQTDRKELNLIFIEKQMTKRANKITKKHYLRVIIFVVTFIIARTIFADWEHFKAGLFGF